MRIIAKPKSCGTNYSFKIERNNSDSKGFANSFELQIFLKKNCSLNKVQICFHKLFNILKLTNTTYINVCMKHLKTICKLSIYFLHNIILCTAVLLNLVFFFTLTVQYFFLYFCQFLGVKIVLYSSFEPEEGIFNANHPFAFILRKSDDILFIGKYVTT